MRRRPLVPKPDFDGAAAQIMTIAYTSPEAREIIGHIIHMAYLEGRGDGLAYASDILKTHNPEKTP